MAYHEFAENMKLRFQVIAGNREPTDTHAKREEEEDGKKNEHEAIVCNNNRTWLEMMIHPEINTL